MIIEGLGRTRMSKLKKNATGRMIHDELERILGMQTKYLRVCIGSKEIYPNASQVDLAKKKLIVIQIKMKLPGGK